MLVLIPRTLYSDKVKLGLLFFVQAVVFVNLNRPTLYGTLETKLVELSLVAGVVVIRN